MGYLTKDAKGQFDYAQLDTIFYYIIPKLAACNVHLEQSDITYGGHIYLRTSVTHSSGEFKASYAYLYPEELIRTGFKNPQEAGKLQQTLGTIKSYQCRYALKNFLCLPVMDRDFDDGEYITDQQALALYDIAKGDAVKLATLLEQLGVESDSKIKAEDYDNAVEILKVLNGGK